MHTNEPAESALHFREHIVGLFGDLSTGDGAGAGSVAFCLDPDPYHLAWTVDTDPYQM